LDGSLEKWRTLARESFLVAGDLPVEQLAELAAREGRRPRPVYQTHKWFARRFGSAFRALLVASGINRDEDFWAAYLNGVDLTGLTVVDPFVGGGTAITEAQRLGATCKASDVDPVAVSVTRFQSRLSNVPDLEDALRQLKKSVGSKLSTFHETENERGRRHIVLHHFWVQTIDCRGCGRSFDVQPHYQLAHDPVMRRQWAACAHCDEVTETCIDQKCLDCSHCGERTVIAAGTTAYGTVQCAICGTKERLIDVSARTGRPPRFRLFALEYLREPPGRRPIPTSSRAFKKADEFDIDRYVAASKKLREEVDGKSLFGRLPRRRIPDHGRTDDRLIGYGYEQYTDLFGDRQLLHLALLADGIQTFEGATREALAIAFSDHLKTNCMLTTYAFGWRRLAPLFSIRAYRHVSRPVELNPWLDGTGRGTFPNAVRRIERAKRWLEAPKESMPGGGFNIPAAAELPPLRPVETWVCSAERLTHLTDRSVDLFVTDPPYFDNIAYSELSDFFLPWHAFLGLAHSVEAGFPRARLEADRNDEASAARFREKLALCFGEIARKLRPKGRLVFTYQHMTDQGWLALAGALAAADLHVIRVFPLLGDTDAGPHKHKDSIRWDAVIVAEPGPSLAQGETRLSVAARAWAEQVARCWISRLENSCNAIFRDADKVNLRRACYAAAVSHETNSARRVWNLAEVLREEVCGR
jgi:putative DNA methylase